VRVLVEEPAGRQPNGRSIEITGGLRRRGLRRRGTGAAVAGVLALAALSGCAKMDSALDKQWIVVDFTPNTSVATALHVRAACSHVQNTPPLALPSNHSVTNILYGVRYDTTNSSPANVAELQTCLQKFSSVVQGLDPEDTSDEGG
jgi:hypothetical protein